MGSTTLAPPAAKRCSTCGEIKPLEDYHRRARAGDGRQSDCKPCAKARTMRWRAENPERWRHHILKSKGYQISLEAYLELLEKQDGRCALCRRTAQEAMGPGYLWLAVDHCHETDRVRGLLCNPCNTVLGMARDDAALLRAAADYLEEHR